MIESVSQSVRGLGAWVGWSGGGKGVSGVGVGKAKQGVENSATHTEQPAGLLSFSSGLPWPVSPLASALLFRLGSTRLLIAR